MKKLFLNILLLPCITFSQETERVELEQKLETKRKELDALYDYIQKQEEYIGHIHERRANLIGEFKKELIKDLQRKKLKMTDDEFVRTYSKFFDDFLDNYYDVAHKIKKQLVDEIDSDKLRAVKFYFLLYEHQKIKLNKMLSRLEDLSDEIMLLENRLETSFFSN